MSVDTAFNEAAVDYDETFTHSSVGSLQRERVYHWLTRWVLNTKRNVLEINCGTGEDMRRLTDMGHRVTATDISSEMIHIAERKNPGKTCKCLDMQEALELYTGEHDVIFSNFGGLNCLSPIELERFIKRCGDVQKTNDRIVWVIMPAACIMEDLYFFITFRWKRMFRRRHMTAVNVGKQTVNTWYYSPGQISEQLYKAGYTSVRTRPVALFIPPSYMAERFKQGSFWLGVLYSLEKIFGRFSFAAGVSDHYIITGRKR